MKSLQRSENYIRNIVFGVEDSLVSTVGLLSGIASAGIGSHTILLTGVVLIFVEAFSMAAGSLLSENSVEEYEEHREMPLASGYSAAVVMFVSYFVSGFVPLLPYICLEPSVALPVSIFTSLLGLLLLGVFSGSYFRINIVHNGLKMLFIGGIAIIIGTFAGILLR